MRCPSGHRLALHKKAERPIDPDRDLGWGIGIGSKLPESTICLLATHPADRPNDGRPVNVVVATRLASPVYDGSHRMLDQPLQGKARLSDPMNDPSAVDASGAKYNAGLLFFLTNCINANQRCESLVVDLACPFHVFPLLSVEAKLVSIVRLPAGETAICSCKRAYSGRGEVRRCPVWVTLK
jgi:hypothetical protein